MVYLYGSQYADLWYLEYVAAQGVELVEILETGHFLIYPDPAEM